MDNLKKYLQENRDKLDCHIPSPEISDRLMKSLMNKDKIKTLKYRYLYYGVAASLAAMFLIVFGPTRFSVKKQIAESKLMSHYQKSVVSQPIITLNKTVKDPLKLSQEKTIEHKGFSGIRKKIDSDKLQLASQNIDRRTSIKIDSIKSSYQNAVKVYLQDFNVKLIVDKEELFLIHKQLMDIDRDEIEIKKMIKEYGLNENLLNALIRLNQRKVLYLKKIQENSLRRKRNLNEI